MEVVEIPTIYTPSLNGDSRHEGVRVASLPSFPFEALFHTSNCKTLILVKIISNHLNLSWVLALPNLLSLYFHKSLLAYALRKLNVYSGCSAFLFPVKDFRILSLQSRKPS
jgi:hypothetical protein